MENFKYLIQNLSKRQKIGILVLFQLIIIIAIITVINFAFKDRNHIETVNSEELSSVPDSEKELYSEELWGIIKKNVSGLDKSIINDAVVRENSYNETLYDDNMKQVDFLVDIDSIKQTYKVTLAWSGDGDVTPIVDCPAYSEMKYKETFCKGVYRNTDSFSLYFPYYVYKEETTDYSECAENDEKCLNAGYDSGLLYTIEGDEDSGVITIESSVCDVDKYNKEALDYIKNETPFYDNPLYTIEYRVNEVDVVCD